MIYVYMDTYGSYYLSKLDDKTIDLGAVLSRDGVSRCKSRRMYFYFYCYFQRIVLLGFFVLN